MPWTPAGWIDGGSGTSNDFSNIPAGYYAISNGSNPVASNNFTEAGTFVTNTGSLILPNISANAALILNGTNTIAASTTSSTELSYVHGVTSAIQTQLNNKLNIPVGLTPGVHMIAASTSAIEDSNIVSESGTVLTIAGTEVITPASNGITLTINNAGGTPELTFNTSTNYLNLNGLTASTALVSDSSKNLISSSATATQVGYLSNVTSDIQTQINGKQASLSGLTSGDFIKATGSGSIGNSSTMSESGTTVTIGGNLLVKASNTNVFDIEDSSGHKFIQTDTTNYIQTIKPYTDGECFNIETAEGNSIFYVQTANPYTSSSVVALCPVSLPNLSTSSIVATDGSSNLVTPTFITYAGTTLSVAGTVDGGSSALTVGNTSQNTTIDGNTLQLTGSGVLVGYGSNTSTSGIINLYGNGGNYAGEVLIQGGNSGTTPTTNNIVVIQGGGSNGGSSDIYGGTSSTIANNVVNIGTSSNPQTLSTVGPATITGSSSTSGTVTIQGGNNSSSPTSNNIVNIQGGGSNGGVVNIYGGTIASSLSSQINLGTSTYTAYSTVNGVFKTQPGADSSGVVSFCNHAGTALVSLNSSTPAWSFNTPIILNSTNGSYTSMPALTFFYTTGTTAAVNSSVTFTLPHSLTYSSVRWIETIVLGNSNAILQGNSNTGYLYTPSANSTNMTIFTGASASSVASSTFYMWFAMVGSAVSFQDLENLGQNDGLTKDTAIPWNPVMTYYEGPPEGMDITKDVGYKIQDLETKISKMEKIVESYEKRVESYEKRVESYEKRVESYEKIVESYEKKILSLIKDKNSRLDEKKESLGSIARANSQSSDDWDAVSESSTAEKED